MHPFIKKYEREDVDVGAWYRSVMISTNGSLTTPNNNQLIGSLDMTSSNSERTAFKPQPSPRIVRSAWRPPPTTSSTSTTPSSPSYPSAISEQRESNRRPSFEAMLEQPTRPNRGFDISSQYVTSKPPPALPSPVEASSSTVTSRPSYRHNMTSVTDSPMLMRSRRDFNYYEKWQPPKGAHYTALSRQTSSTSSPYSGSYGSPLHYSSRNTTAPNYDEEVNTSPTPAVVSSTSSASGRPIMTVPRYGYRESPRTARKFEFTYPQTSYHTTSSAGPSTSDRGATASGEQTSSFNGTPGRYAPRRLSTEQHHVLPHHYSQYYQSATSAAASAGGSDRHHHHHHHRGRSPTREPQMQQPHSPSSAQQRSPSQERQQKNYLTSWRSTLSSWTPSFRRLRTASSDRSNFDTSRRFQPSYRSWNEKDNFYPMKR